MKILVTGGMGFIGSNFIRHIMATANEIDELINIDSLSYGSNLFNLKDFEGNEHYKFIKGDIADLTVVSELVKEVDAVINFAANSHVDRSIVNPSLFFRSNTEGVLVLLEAIRLANRDVRLIQVSTDEVYGDILSGSFKEKDRLKPSSPYACSKAAADLFCIAYHRTYALDVIVTRCTNNFGPYQFPEKLIPKVIIRAKLGLKVPIYGTGKNARDWIYVVDHCEALEQILAKGKSGELYNISSGNELENLMVVRKILEMMDKNDELVEFVENRPGHDIRYSLDSSKLTQEIGWRPKYEFEEALKKTVDWYLSTKWWMHLADERSLHPTPWKLRW